jgi:single-strand DNA-binding protein
LQTVKSLHRRKQTTTKIIYKPFKILHAMNALKNKVQLIGHVGKDPVIRDLEGGKKVASLSLATKDVYVNKSGDQKEQTQWHNVVAWGKTAEIIEKFVDKGKKIGLTGKLTSRSYDDKEGNKRYVTEVVINELLLMN